MNGALERYHGTFKAELKKDKAVVQGRTMTWLLNAMLRLENFYWCTSRVKWQGRIRNRKIEEQVWNTIHRARAIPDCDVILMQHEGQKIARVKSVSIAGKEHLVVNYDKDTCTCTCGLSVQGNSYKHQVFLLISFSLCFVLWNFLWPDVGLSSIFIWLSVFFIRSYECFIFGLLHTCKIRVSLIFVGKVASHGRTID